MLEYKVLYDDILVFKNQNDCCTIKAGNDNIPYVSRIEIDGEDIDGFINPRNTFLKEEIDWFIKNYFQIVRG